MKGGVVLSNSSQNWMQFCLKLLINRLRESANWVYSYPLLCHVVDSTQNIKALLRKQRMLVNWRKRCHNNQKLPMCSIEHTKFASNDWSPRTMHKLLQFSTHPKLKLMIKRFAWSGLIIARRFATSKCRVYETTKLVGLEMQLHLLLLYFYNQTHKDMGSSINDVTKILGPLPT